MLWSSKCVVAMFSGHQHEGGYGQDEHGIHHIIFPAILEAAPGNGVLMCALVITQAGDTAHGICEIYDDRIELTGYGARVPNRTLMFS